MNGLDSIVNHKFAILIVGSIQEIILLLLCMRTILKTLHNVWEVSLEEISTQNGPFNSNSNSISSCVSQWNCFKFEIHYKS